MTSSWGHLVARLADTVSSRPLTAQEHAYVDRLLVSDAERSLYWNQAVPDQRHGMVGARHVHSQAPGRADLARAALFHDVGKQEAALGAVGRTLAEGGAKLGLSLRGRFDLHMAHGEIGAGLLRQVGAEELVVEFAYSHHSQRPPAISPGDWNLLRQADRARPPHRPS